MSEDILAYLQRAIDAPDDDLDAGPITKIMRRQNLIWARDEIFLLRNENKRLFEWQAKAENALKHAQAFLDDEHPKWEDHRILGIDCVLRLIREAIATAAERTDR